MSIFRKQSEIPWKAIEKYRETLCSEQFGWLAEIYDGKKPVYQGTKKGYMSYYLMVDAIGVKQAANGIKVNKKQLQQAKDWITADLGRTNILAEKDYVQRTMQAGGLITVTYDPIENKQLWALTPYGAELFRTFFYSLNKEVGKPPTDWGAEFPKVMLKIFEFMGKATDMMNGMNANMNGKKKDVFGIGKMANVGNFGTRPVKKTTKKKKKKKRYKYKKKYSYKTDEPKEDKYDYSFGDKNAKYW